MSNEKSRKNKDIKKSGKSNYKSNKNYESRRHNCDNAEVFHKGEKASKGGSFKMDDVRGNDIEWWNRSPLYPLASSVQYNMYPGYVYDHEQLQPLDPNFPAHYPVGSKFTDGAVACYRYVPMFVSSNSNDPINQCFNTLFARLVQNTNSANVGFQQADIAMLTIGLQSIVTLIAEAKRAIGLTNVFYRENAFYPMVILKALGYDYDVMQRERPLYVSRLQTIIRNFNAMGIPSYIDLFKRGTQLGRNVYSDEDSLSGFPFVFKCCGYYLYDDVNSQLMYHSVDELNANTNFNSLLDHIEDCLEAFRNTSDLGNIMGAIRRAFPETALIQIDDISYEETTYPSFDRNVMWQVNNMTILGALGDLTEMDITQNAAANILVQQPHWRGSENKTFAPESFYVNSYNGEVGNEFIMEATRLMPVLEYDAEQSAFSFRSCGTEVVLNGRLYYRQVLENGEFNIVTWEPFGTIKELSEAGLTGDSFYTDLTRITKLRNHPRIWLTDESEHKVYGFIGDLFVYTQVNREQVDTLHLAALQSMFSLTV